MNSMLLKVPAASERKGFIGKNMASLRSEENIKSLETLVRLCFENMLIKLVIIPEGKKDKAGNETVVCKAYFFKKNKDELDYKFISMEVGRQNANGNFTLESNTTIIRNDFNRKRYLPSEWNGDFFSVKQLINLAGPDNQIVFYDKLKTGPTF